MKRLVVVAAVVVVVVALLVLSVTRVPAGSAAWCAGRVLGPGVQLKSPFSRAVPYPEGEQRLTLEREIAASDRGVKKVTVDLAYRWSPGRLSLDPVHPERLADRVETALAGLDGRYPERTLGASVRVAVPESLAALPIDITALEVRYPGEPFEALAKAARPTGMRTVVVGLDGLDWVLLDRLIDEGRCPTFARMKREGAWGEIVSRPPVLSPLIWTTMATGRLPEDHGVLDFVVTDPATGEDIPITNQSRRVHAFWNLLSAVGQSVDLVNWWATYPAEPIEGVMVSERVFYQLFGIRPSLDDPANIYPPELIPELLPLVRDADDVTFEEVSRYADIDRAEYEAAIERARLAENPYDERVNHLRKILAVTDAVFDMGAWLLANREADLTALYVEGTDTIGHRFAHFLPPKLDWVSREDYDRYHMTMARYYERVDRRLGELMAGADSSLTWIVAADHGFYTGAARPSVLPDDFVTGAPQWHRMTGVYMAYGPEVRPGRIARVHIDDLCRTLLRIHGVPASRELRGRALEDMMRPEWLEAHPAPDEVATYADLPRSWIAEEARSVLDEARMKELRALGYLGSSGRSAGREAAAAPTAPPERGAVRPTEPYNQAKIAVRRGDLDAAERLFLEALEIDPQFAIAMISLADVYSEKGDHDASLRWVLRALETGSDLLPGTTLVQFVREADAAGRLERVLPALEMIRGRWESSSSYFTARGMTHRLQGDLDAAEREFLEALEVDAGDPIATEELLALAAQGRPLDVDGILSRHLDAVQGDLKRLNDLAVVCLRQGRPAIAERALRRVLGSDPSNPGVAGNLAVALQMQGKGEEAAEVLADAAEARPDDGQLRFNLGAVLASLGRNEEALEAIEAAQRLGTRGPRVSSAKAKVLVRSGRIAEAESELAAAAQKWPDDAELRELLAALRQGG